MYVVYFIDLFIDIFVGFLELNLFYIFLLVIFSGLYDWCIDGFGFVEC